MATIKGVWVLNENLDPPQSSSVEHKVQQEVNFTFTTNGQIQQGLWLNIAKIQGGNGPTALNYVYSDGAAVWGVYNSRKGWTDQALRTVDFGSVEQEVSEEWYTWLTANATKQSMTANYLEFRSSHSILLRTYNALKNWDGILEYSTDGTSWNVWEGSLIYSTTGKLCLRGTGNTRIAETSAGALANSFLENRWVLMGQDISCLGNIENLLDYGMVAEGKHPPMAKGCFNYIFYGCENLISAPELPATTLSERCYLNLFYGTSITEAPELPATTLTYQCYFGMFESCKNLTIPPALPATNLAAECYKHMFQYDISLTKIPKLPATKLEQECYAYMFRGCTSIKLSTTQTAEYRTVFRIPSSGTATSATNALLSMVDNTGGTFSGTPSINTTYYLYEESEYTLITYDGVTVEMDGELPATLECEGKKARTDIVIIPAFPVKIAYGNIVHTADEGAPATLVCSGKKMRADVVITSDITTNFILADGSMLVTSDGQIFETQ